MDNQLLICGLLLAFKHFWLDGPLQTPYQYKNKGTFGHPGGLLHAGLHGAATAMIFAPVGLWWFGIVDAVVHYFVDLSKVKLTAKYLWAYYDADSLRITSDWYFYALMADQCLHFSTYIMLLWLK